MAVRSAGAKEREITPEEENRISEHNKAATLEKMTRAARPRDHSPVHVCARAGIYLKGKRDCGTYNYRLSLCLFTPVAK